MYSISEEYRNKSLQENRRWQLRQTKLTPRSGDPQSFDKGYRC